MPPTSPHHRAFFSNQPTITTAGPQKGSASFLPRTDLSQGVLTQSNSLLSLLNRPPSTFLVPRFGTFNPLSKIFLVRFRLGSGISETIFAFFQIFLATGRLFAENLARILGRVKGFAWRVHPGGGLVSRFRPCFRPWPCVRGACLPAACSITANGKNRPPWGLNWVLSVRPCCRSRGAFIISLACVPCQVRDKGRKFSTQIFKPVHFLCSSCPVHHRKMTTGHKKRNGLLFGRFSMGCMVFLLFSI